MSNKKKEKDGVRDNDRVFKSAPVTAHQFVKSKSIKESTLLKSRPTAWHIYGYPFIAVYVLYGYFLWHYYEGFSREFTWLTFLLTLSLHALSFLIGKWSVRLFAYLNCGRVEDPYQADVILIIPQAHHGSSALCEIEKRRTGKQPILFFHFQKKKFIHDPAKRQFVKLDYLPSHKHPFGYYHSHRGLATEEEIDGWLEKYGKNTFTVPVPTFGELFKEHVVAPFFVFQLFCVALWFMDEMWYYSLFTLFMLFTFESTVVFQRLRTLQEFRSMANPPYPIHVYREGEWIEIQSDLLLPGDMASITRQKDDNPIPADILLLDGSCIVNEAMLSGESTPQLKEPALLRDRTEIYNLDLDKGNTLFAGTKILQVTAPEKEHDVSTPDGGCLGIVLRTGFATQQGKLVRTIIFSTERVTANNLESLLFILFLLFFAIIAAWYVWTEGSKLEGRDQSKLLLHCILIITSVVPPELPMELSLAVNNSLIALSRCYVFCTEPFRIPFAGRIDIACFDKTGTLTAENLIVEGVTGLLLKDNKNDLESLADANEIPVTTRHVLASAHALVMLDDGIIGDPMEKNTLEWIDWSLSKGDVVTSKTTSASKKAQSSIRILRRFHFSSALKRMSTVSYLDETKVLISAKGAPETIQEMLAVVPEGYEEHYKSWARKGKRVLALAYKVLPQKKTLGQIREMHRHEAESDLIFAGFLVFYCPLKKDSIEAIHALRTSSHRTVMITGDNALTACHIAHEVGIVDRPVLIGDVWHDTKTFSWRTVDDLVRFDDYSTSATTLDDRLDEYDLCLSGDGLAHVVDTLSFKALLPRVWVYARVSPSQKETILTRLKSAGYYTIMCGDGTNDVGALKQAHVGIALLDSTPEDLAKLAQKMAEKRKRDILAKQEELRKRWGLPPDPNSQAQLTQGQSTIAARGSTQRKAANTLETMMDQMAEMEDDVPKIKFGDASVAAPFTSKITSVMSGINLILSYGDLYFSDELPGYIVVNIVRQGRATLVAMIQMYKILALNSLIMAYSLSVLHLEGIKQGDWQATIAGLLITACFFGIASSKPTEKLSKRRPQPNIFNFYIILSVLGQSLVHVLALVYIRGQSLQYSEELDEVLPIDAEFKPNLLNSAVYLVSLIMQISTFAINYQGLPFRESLFQNKALFNSLVIVSGIAFGAAAEISEDLNDWMQLVAFPDEFRVKLLTTMFLDLGVAWLIEVGTWSLFSNNAPQASLFPKRKKNKTL